MFETPFSKFSFIFALIISSIILFIIFLSSSQNSITALVFCDVGQGDVIYLRIKNQTDILVDAGPDRKILDCLGKNMPFFDRTIELAIISHAQKDHFGGLLYILDRYDVKKIWMSGVHGNSRSFRELLEKIDAKRILLEFPKAGEISILSGAKIDFFWPSDEFIAKSTFSEEGLPAYFKQTPKDLNDFSLIFSLEIKDAKVLFTGDAPPYILNGLLYQPKIKSNFLKIPHHGSKNGLTVEFLKLADPSYGVISVGKKNSYGHPAKEVLVMLKTSNIKIRRTDTEGDIVFKFKN